MYQKHSLRFDGIIGSKKWNFGKNAELNSAVKYLVEQVDIFQQTCIKELKNHTDQLQSWWNILYIQY